MMQQEVAKRLFAEPGTKDYGRLTLAARLYTDMEHAFDVSPHCFTPEPEVRSTVIRLRFHSKLRELRLNETELLELIRISFGQRRKKLITTLSREKRFGKSREEWLGVFAACGISPDARAEELLGKDFIALAREIRGRCDLT